jgi:hypothetical protein
MQVRTARLFAIATLCFSFPLLSGAFAVAAQGPKKTSVPAAPEKVATQTTLPSAPNYATMTAELRAVLAIEDVRKTSEDSFGAVTKIDGKIVAIFAASSPATVKSELARKLKGLDVDVRFTSLSRTKVRDLAKSVSDRVETKGFTYNALTNEIVVIVNSSEAIAGAQTQGDSAIRQSGNSVKLRAVVPKAAIPLTGGRGLGAQLQNGQISVTPLCTTTFGVASASIIGSMTAGHCRAIGQTVNGGTSPIASYRVDTNTDLTLAQARRTDAHWDSVVVGNPGATWNTYTGPTPWIGFPTNSQLSGNVDLPSQTIHMPTNFNVCWFGVANGQQQCSWATEYPYVIGLTSGNNGVEGSAYTLNTWKMNSTACQEGDSGSPIWFGSNAANNSYPVGIIVAKAVDGSCLALSIDDQLTNAAVTML